MDGKKVITATLALVLPLSAIAQNCKTESIHPTAPAERYIVDSENGTVIDIETRLMWDMCSLGQVYQDQRCTGEPLHFSSMYDALNAVPNQGAGGYTNYRLPNIKELDSIIERQCNSPAINLSVFPDTPSTVFLSSTPTALYLNGGDESRNINFEDGSDIYGPEDTLRYVRLVRDIE